MSEERRITKLWERYQSGKSYQAEMNFLDLFPLCVDFKEGRQWPPATKATKHLPRPVFNICEKYVRTKRANILNQTVKMVFTPAEGNDDPLAAEFESKGAKAYTDFAENLWKEIDQDDLNEDCVDDAATLGTGILHYYWDANASGGHRYPFSGALRGEVLDPLTVMFGNPQETDVQQQPYILIATKVLVRDVKRMAEEEGLPESEIALICADEEEPDTYIASTFINERERKCTLITMYYRDHGLVRYDRATKTVVVVSGRSLTPGIPDRKGKKKRDEGEETPDGMQLYPIAVMPWQKRKRSIYGIGEVESMIPAQKAINWLMGMNILSVQDTAWPKLLVKPGALRQEVTNAPGEIIEDHSPQGNGLAYLRGAGLGTGATELTDKLLDLLQYSSGVSEVVSGEPFTATMAASAIIALQNQAKQPIENIQNRFYRVIRDVGRIWEEFFKFYYTQPRQMLVETVTGEDGTVVFVGTDFAQESFHLEIDVGAGSEFSESLSVATLDKLFDAGHIDLDTYIELAPKNVMPFKEQLKRRIEQQREQQAVGAPQEAPQGAPIDMPQGAAPLGVPLPETPSIPPIRGVSV